MLTNLIWCEETTSTNDELRKYEDGTCLFCDTQSAGKGRLNRNWISERGNLFFSYKLQDSSTGSFLSILVGIAVHKALTELSNSQYFLKWPNDILDHNEKKLSGILVEQCNDSWIVGIGINLNNVNEEYGYADIDSDRVWIIHLIIRLMHELINEDRNQLVFYWKQNSLFQIKPNIEVELGSKTINGSFYNLSEDGSLLIKEQKTKEIIQIHSGDILSCRSRPE